MMGEKAPWEEGTKKAVRITPDLGVCNPPMIEVQLRDVGRNFVQVVAQSYHDLAEYIEEAAKNVINRFPWQQAIEKKLTEEVNKMVDWEVSLAIGSGPVREMLREKIAKAVKNKIELYRKFHPEEF